MALPACARACGGAARRVRRHVGRVRLARPRVSPLHVAAKVAIVAGCCGGGLLMAQPLLPGAAAPEPGAALSMPYVPAWADISVEAAQSYDRGLVAFAPPGAVPMPEPSGLLPFAAGFAALAFIRRRSA